MLIMLLNEEHLLIQNTAKSLADKVIRPYSAAWAKTQQFPHSALEALSHAGFMGMLIPEELGGANLDHVAYALIITEIAKADGAVSTIVSVHNSVASLPIVKFGTTAQKQEFLPRMAKGEWLGAFCLSEPQAGSDASQLSTTAQQQGETFILNGVKQFVTSAQHAKVAIVFAVTDPSLKHKGISAFIVPTDTPGYQIAKIEHKMGQEASEIAQVVFDNVQIPAHYLLGNLGQGYAIALSNLECGRLGIAAQALGMAEEAYHLSVNYTQVRKSFGKFLYEHQAIGYKLADMATELEAAKQLLFYAAQKRDAHLPCLKEASMAKLFASEVAERICRHAIQIYGGYGYLQDFPLERIYRDVRVTSIYEGTSDIQRMIIARELLKDH
jgi:butyryl-CoA dehydrogenase